MEKIVAEIKQKPELEGLPDAVAERALRAYLSRHKLSIPTKPKERKIVIKAIRAELRRYAGQYVLSKSSKKRQELLIAHNFTSLLVTHSSTKERIHEYGQIKKIIYSINPQSILDLGCGLNPLAIATPNIIYHAYDLNANDLYLVKQFFEHNNIHGDVHHTDISKVNSFPAVDVCLMFKLLDILPNKINSARSLLTRIDAKYFLVSFATRTLSGKPMNRPYRRWFEHILQELQYPFTVKRTSQELFYLITKTI